MNEIAQLTSNYWFWFGAAIILTIAEVTIGGNFFLLWIGLSSLFVGILQWLLPSLSWEFQWLLFSFVSIISIAFWWQYLKKQPKKMKNTHLNQGAERFIGKTYNLIEPIINGKGKIKVGDSVWLVTGPDLKMGSKVHVVAVDGVLLKVIAVE